MDKYLTKMEEATVVQGNWGDDDRGCRMLARIQAITVAVKDCYGILECSQEDFEELAAVLLAKSLEELGKLYPDEAFFRYRNVNNKPLKGLKVNDGSKMEVCFDYEPDAPFDQSVADQQKLYVIHTMIPKCSKKIVGMMSRKMVRAEDKKFEDLKPDELQRMQQLLDIVVDSVSAEELKELKIDVNALKKRVEAEIAKF